MSFPPMESRWESLWVKQTLVTWLPWPSYLWLGAWRGKERERESTLDIVNPITSHLCRLFVFTEEKHVRSDQACSSGRNFECFTPSCPGKIVFYCGVKKSKNNYYVLKSGFLQSAIAVSYYLHWDLLKIISAAVRKIQVKTALDNTAQFTTVICSSNH